eukprot:469550-Amphidinium_carterae.2
MRGCREAIRAECEICDPGDECACSRRAQSRHATLQEDVLGLRSVWKQLSYFQSLSLSLCNLEVQYVRSNSGHEWRASLGLLDELPQWSLLPSRSINAAHELSFSMCTQMKAQMHSCRDSSRGILDNSSRSLTDLGI